MRSLTVDDGVGARIKTTTSRRLPRRRHTSTSRGQHLAIATVVSAADAYLTVGGEPEPFRSRTRKPRVEDKISVVDRTGECSLGYRPDTSGYGYSISAASF